MVLSTLLAAWLALGGVAQAQTANTADALERLDELLAVRIEEGRLSAEALQPAILVSARPRYEASQGWFAVRVIEVLQGTLGEGALRVCEACMVPRAYVEEGHMVYQTGPIGLEEVVRLDSQTRGKAAPARTAVWVEETRSGVTVRIIDLASGGVVFAQNVDPDLVENRNTQRMYTLSEELERRARGDSVTQAFVDFGLYPGQHISLDWTEQWGKTNANLSGVTISLVDPIAGVGAVHYRRVDFFDVLVGAQVVMSLPTALVNSVGDGDTGDLIDPLLTAVGVVRVPFGRSNYGAVLLASTNGQVGLGISLMNISLLPVIP